MIVSLTDAPTIIGVSVTIGFLTLAGLAYWVFRKHHNNEINLSNPEIAHQVLPSSEAIEMSMFDCNFICINLFFTIGFGLAFGRFQ